MGAEPADAAAGVPAHRDRRRGGLAGRGRRGTRMGERRRVLLRLALGDDAVDRPRRRRRRAGSAPLGEQRPDDVLLLRRRARSAPRVRPGRAAGAAAVRAAAAGGDRRHGGGGRHLPRLQRRPLVRSRLGNRDVDRHCLRARPARARRPALSRPPAGVHAHGRRRRRHRRARRHRDRLHGDARRRAAPCGRRPVRSRPRPAQRPRPRRSRLLRARGRRLGGAARVGSRAGRHRPRDGPPGLRLPGSAVQPRTRDRAVPRVPRAADGGAGTRRPAVELRSATLGQRTAAAALPPLDELRDRAAVRARERGHRDRRRLPGARLHARRSRSGSCSATSSASRWASSAARGC